MQILFNFRGNHIATSIDDRLYSVRGNHIGYFNESAKIFTDLQGKYLGQIPFSNRLLQSDIYRFEGIDFGVRYEYESIGSIGEIGSGGDIGTIEGFSDIPLQKLK